jgi:hypothetical protein
MDVAGSTRHADTSTCRESRSLGSSVKPTAISRLGAVMIMIDCTQTIDEVAKGYSVFQDNEDICSPERSDLFDLQRQLAGL